MATDPAVQAADLEDAVWTLINDDLTRSIGNYENPAHAAVRLALAAATPLIRRQAFIEAAEAIQALMDRQPLFDALDGMVHYTYGEAVAVVRGLGEGTDA